MTEELDEVTKEMLHNAGREMAAEMMANACSTAKDKEQMHSQIRVLSYLAKHILATIVYNAVRQSGANQEVALAIVANELRREFEWVKAQPEGELEFSKPGGGE
jgi:hypothetical protein